MWRIGMFVAIIWQIVQFLIGWFVLSWLALHKSIHGEGFEKPCIRVVRHTKMFGLGLGVWMFIPKDCEDDVYMHEKGHCIQSMILGPLYLPTVGICSLAFCLWDMLMHRKWDVADRKRWYYARWTERWADRLGKVERNF